MKSFRWFFWFCPDHDGNNNRLDHVSRILYRLPNSFPAGCIPGGYAGFDLRLRDRELYSLGAFLLDDRPDTDVHLRLRWLDLRRTENGTFRDPFQNLFNEFKKQTHPHAIIPVRMDSHIVSGEVVHRVLAFAFAYMSLIVLSCAVLMLDGLGFEESIGAAVSAISNVDSSGLGKPKPVDNFSEVPVVSKWFLSLLMMTGRLEIFTVLTLLCSGILETIK